MNGYFCSVCRRKKFLRSISRNNFCFFCFKKTTTNIHISVVDNLELRDSFQMKIKSKSFKGFVSKVWGGWFPSKKSEHGVDMTRVIDRQMDEYHEVVKDYKTGKMIHETHEKLSEHVGHGSAKFKHPIQSK